MNILHVLSQFEVTGAETLAATIAGHQAAAGHRVTIVSDTFHTDTRADVLHLPIGKRDFLQRIKNIAALRILIRNRGIDIVHAHSRAASWVAYFATRRSAVPLVSMIHGKQHIHFSSRHSKIFGEKLIAVCEALKEHLCRDLGYAENAITVIRNGIDLHAWFPEPGPEAQAESKMISLVGRLSGPKGDVARTIVEEVFPAVFAVHPDAELRIVGGMRESEWLSESVRQVNRRLGAEAVCASGFVNDVRHVYSSSSVVIGSGRVAMEALACGARVIAAGESSYIGLVSESTSGRALATNFGDAGFSHHFPVNAAIEEIGRVLSHRHTYSDWSAGFAAREFDAAHVSQQIIRVYAEAAARKRGISEIPILMYHRVTDGAPAGTRHGIYVTTREFDAQLHALQRKGCTTLTVRDLRAIVLGERIIPRRPVLLTFDDGYEDNYLHAFPLLKRYGMNATIFILGDPSIRSNVWDRSGGEPVARLMSDEQCRDMISYGIDFGAHTLHHTKLTDVGADDARIEIESSKRMIEDRLQYDIHSIAYPYGAVNESIKAMTKKAGYTFGIATDSGTKDFWSDPFELRRIPVFPGASKFSFWKKTTGKYHAYKKVQ
jgi:peptidoglycan/xylan/chitin deacetylase (PgdA/CDA1 family)/glycosyltransferase involved in cell wall biosynthesis